MLSMTMLVWAWLLAVETGSPVGGDFSEWSHGYALAARVHLLADPARTAREVERLSIGAEIQYRPVGEAGWCEVVVFGTPRRGFSLCALVGQKRPTLEALVSRLERTEPKSAIFPVLVNRISALSPSYSLLAWACWRSYDFETYRCDPRIERLFATLDGIRRGADLKPIACCWNLPGDDERKIWEASGKKKLNILQTCKGYYRVDRVGPSRMEGAALQVVQDGEDGPRLVARPSLFRSRSDVYLVPGGRHLAAMRNRGGPFLDPDDRAEARYRTRGFFDAADLLEYTKLLPDGRVVISLLPTRPLGSYGRLPSVRARFPDRPHVYIVTRKGGLEDGSMIELVESYDSICRDYRPYHNQAVFASKRPMDVATILLTRIHLDRDKVRIKWHRGGTFSVDLDGDGRADYAHLVENTACDEEVGGCCHGRVAININGAWHVAATLCVVVCT